MGQAQGDLCRICKVNLGREWTLTSYSITNHTYVVGDYFMTACYSSLFTEEKVPSPIVLIAKQVFFSKLTILVPNSEQV